MKHLNKIILGLTITISSYALGQSSIYTNDMDYVIGDVKQAFIQDKISDDVQIANLLAGFKTMQVNGIRIPIFPEGLEPNEFALKYFYQQAIAQGFKIFANPAQGTGGKHLATGEFFSDKTVLNDPDMTQALIDRVLDFESEYPDCSWINPFNEDSRTETVWSADQMNTIYSSISAALQSDVDNETELIGACAWGLVAAIDIFEETNIKDYITVSTAHNLGFNHDLWPEFIEMSHAADLPVWDSEVNHNQKYADKSTRLEAAIEYGVDGLVLYDSYGFIDLETGEVNATGQEWMDLYLKDPTSINDNYGTETFANIYQESNGFRINFLTTGQEYNVSIVDITGKQVRSYQETGNEIIVDNLEQGIYIVSIKADNEVQVEKVMAL